MHSFPMTGLARRWAMPACLAAAALLLPGAASAHVTFEAQQAPVGASYKAVLRVPHGCAGAATTRIRVQIPDGVITVKPMPKPGWTLDTVRGPYGRTYDYFGTQLTEGVREISWSGNTLPDAWYDEFVFQAYLTGGLAPNTTLYVPVVQDCEGGKADRWIEIPTGDRTARDYRYPAPGIRLLPGTAQPGSAH